MYLIGGNEEAGCSAKMACNPCSVFQNVLLVILRADADIEAIIHAGGYAAFAGEEAMIDHTLVAG